MNIYERVNYSMEDAVADQFAMATKLGYFKEKHMEPKFEVGEMIEVTAGDNDSKWQKRIFVCFFDNIYFCTCNEEPIRNTATLIGWKQARKIEPKCTCTICPECGKKR